MTERVSLTNLLGTFRFASNLTLLAADLAGSKWVYKPDRGVQPLWDFAGETLAAREVLTYEAALRMGLDLVPETRLADGPAGPGSAQRYIDEDLEFDPRPLLGEILDPCLWPVAVLDVVTNNADRKIGHLIKELVTGKLWAIDNGLTFHSDHKLRTVLWGFAGKALPTHLVGAVSLLRGFEQRVGDMLSLAEAKAFRRRIENLLKSRVHPAPPRDRPAIPWPVW